MLMLICALLRYYAASSGNPLPTFRGYLFESLYSFRTDDCSAFNKHSLTSHPSVKGFGFVAVTLANIKDALSAHSVDSHTLRKLPVTFVIMILIRTMYQFYGVTLNMKHFSLWRVS